jgi:hypothetical protein
MNLTEIFRVLGVELASDTSLRLTNTLNTRRNEWTQVATMAYLWGQRREHPIERASTATAEATRVPSTSAWSPDFPY